MRVISMLSTENNRLEVVDHVLRKSIRFEVTGTHIAILTVYLVYRFGYGCVWEFVLLIVLQQKSLYTKVNHMRLEVVDHVLRKSIRFEVTGTHIAILTVYLVYRFGYGCVWEFVLLIVLQQKSLYTKVNHMVSIEEQQRVVVVYMGTKLLCWEILLLVLIFTVEMVVGRVGSRIPATSYLRPLTMDYDVSKFLYCLLGNFWFFRDFNTPVSYGQKVAPLPEDRVGGDGEGDGVDLEAERRKIKAENRVMRRVFRGQEEEQKVPFPVLVKVEKTEDKGDGKKVALDLKEVVHLVKVDRDGKDQTAPSKEMKGTGHTSKKMDRKIKVPTRSSNIYMDKEFFKSAMNKTANMQPILTTDAET
ncbi:Ribosomal protein L1 [Artemisia annua]|uniref:Ribosomal protein L1 n=1 Tax=Artemisia annua TaxID=35608 RepID=A0A2U1PW67_ARTAN|nr:Ribosomal protein L1 [Artemisia annua]